MVGAARFELATIPSQTEHSTAELRAGFNNKIINILVDLINYQMLKFTVPILVMCGVRTGSCCSIASLSWSSSPLTFSSLFSRPKARSRSILFPQKSSPPMLLGPAASYFNDIERQIGGAAGI